MIYHVITGEYPPALGGVADYCRLLASALAHAGEAVHVWTGPAEGDTPDEPGVTVHRIAGRWSTADLARIGAALDEFPAPRALLVQYVPNAWGYKGLNFGFCRWLVERRARGDEIRVLFHEVTYPFDPFDKPTRWVLPLAHRVMARQVLKAATFVDVTIPAWDRLLRSCRPGDRRAFGVRPVPSNVPVVDDPAGVAAVRGRLAPQGGAIVGAFGSFAEKIAVLHADLLPRLLTGASRPRRRVDRPQRRSDRRADQRGASRTCGPHHGDGWRLGGRGVAAVAGVRRGGAAVSGRRFRTADQRDGEPGARRCRGDERGPAHRGILGGVGGRGTRGNARARRARRRRGTLAGRSGAARVGAAGRDLHEQRFAIERTVEAILGASAQVAS